VRALPILATQLTSEIDRPVFSAPGQLFEGLESTAVRCLACAHRCVVADGARGACGVRRNRAGVLLVPANHVARRYVRAVETNTVFHVLPGARSLTFGMFGCDLRCPYCHNHRVSQALRDGDHEEHPTPITALQLADEAVAAQCSVVCAAYNEPMVSAEWTREVFAAARHRRLLTALISDGHSTPEAVHYLRGVCDVLRIDFKAHDESGYRKLGGRLQPVLDTIALGRSLGYWVEVVTLVVPGLNHEERVLSRMGAMLREIDPAIPWHLNGFVPRYRMRHAPPADAALLMLAAGTAYVAGMRYVYVGNAPAAAELAHTRCWSCRAVLIRRRDYEVTESRLVHGACSDCSAPIQGLWQPGASFPG
jgi:pyruvate formate lyase activating enzyme